jgi:hypothetical protein
MNLFTRIVCFALIIGALVLIAFKGTAHSQISDGVREAAERISGDRFNESAITPRGARIYSVTPVSQAMAAAVDKGLSELFTVARSPKYRYKKKLRYTEYTVFIARPDRKEGQNGEYSPDIAIGAAQYAGTKYDKGGYIYASGMIISASSNAFLIADHDKDFERVSRVVRYEGEHLVLYHNDRDEYIRTRDHSKGGGHPILKP